MLGYRYDGEKYIIVPDEAEIVRSIFTDYLEGKGVVAIIKRLNASGILTQQGFTWHKSAITRVLKNYTYTGNLLLQTKFRENHLTKRTLVIESMPEAEALWSLMDGTVKMSSGMDKYAKSLGATAYD